MNLTWSAATVLLVLITPAFLLLVLLRVKFFPKIRTVGPKDSTLLLVCCFLSVMSNFDILAEMGSFVATHSLNYVELRTWERDILVRLCSDWSWAIKPVTQFVVWLSDSKGLEHNFILFLLDLHLRTLGLGIAVSSIVIKIINLAEWREYLPYRPTEKPKGCLGRDWLKIKDWFFDWFAGPRFDEEQSKYLSELKKKKWKWIEDIRHAFYHPWAIITSTNRRREILMVDVLTLEGSMYSGMLTTWVPDGDGISAISMEYALRYSEDKATQQTAENGAPKSNRKKELVKNHGEMVIPASQVVTYHFWEIRRFSPFTVIVKKAADIEVVKWYVLLAFVHQGFIKKIRVQFGVKDDEIGVLAGRLDEWMYDNNIKLPLGLLEMQVDFGENEDSQIEEQSVDKSG